MQTRANLKPTLTTNRSHCCGVIPRGCVPSFGKGGHCFINISNLFYLQMQGLKDPPQYKLPAQPFTSLAAANNAQSLQTSSVFAFLCSPPSLSSKSSSLHPLRGFCALCTHNESAYGCVPSFPGKWIGLSKSPICPSKDKNQGIFLWQPRESAQQVRSGTYSTSPLGNTQLRSDFWSPGYNAGCCADSRPFVSGKQTRSQLGGDEIKAGHSCLNVCHFGGDFV